MAGIHSVVRAGLRERLVALAGVPPVAWEGYEYTPLVGVTYFRERLVPQSSELTSLGRFGRLKHEGVWFVDVYTQAGKGPSLADDWVDKVLTQFAPGTIITKGSTLIRFNRGLGGPVILSPQWLMRSCTINWFTESTNTV